MNSDDRDSSVQEMPAGKTREEIVGLRRRRLITSGVGVSTIIATVASRPAWANGICTKSGLQSANLSGQHEILGCGKSAGFWMVNQYAWPSRVSPGASFTGTFGSAPYDGTTLFSGKSLGWVISYTGGSGNPGNIGLHLIGAYINSFAFPQNSPGGPGFAYSTAQIISMFTTAGNNATGKTKNDQKTIYTNLARTLEIANDSFDAKTEWAH